MEKIPTVSRISLEAGKFFQRCNQSSQPNHRSVAAITGLVAGEDSKP
jgi:hypothetical protein